MKPRVLLGLTGSVASILYTKLIGQLSLIGPVTVLLTEKSWAFIDFDQLKTALNTYGGSFIMDKDEWKWNNTNKWKKDDSILHINLRNTHSAFVIAPCSANTLAKISNGICDNLLTTVARAWDRNRPFIIAPSMNTEMWEHPITEQQLSTFKSFSKHNSSSRFKIIGMWGKWNGSTC
jgi:phosphopantothenoylcysteine decarboxylase